jgi:hypothetical protein
MFYPSFYETLFTLLALLQHFETLEISGKHTI